MRILLVEDDELLGNGVYTGLCQEGYTVDWLKDGATAEYALRSELFDAIVLDLGLPKLPGIDLGKEVNHQFWMFQPLRIGLRHQQQLLSLIPH